MNRATLWLQLRRTAALIIMLLLWEGISALGWVDPFYAPPPSAIGGAIAELFIDGEIYKHLQATFGAALLGFLAALVRPVAELLEPVMAMLNAIPRVILAPLFIIWLGIGIASKVALSFILVVVLTFFAVYNGIRDVDTRLVERVKTLGGGPLVLLREVYVPSVVAWVMGSLKVAVGFAFTGAVVGEFVASSRGLGYLLAFAQSQYNAQLTFALIVLILVFVMLLFGLAGTLERHLLRWKYRR